MYHYHLISRTLLSRPKISQLPSLQIDEFYEVQKRRSTEFERQKLPKVPSGSWLVPSLGIDAGRACWFSVDAEEGFLAFEGPATTLLGKFEREKNQTQIN